MLAVTLFVFRELIQAGPGGMHKCTLEAQSSASAATLKACLAGLCERRLVYAIHVQEGVMYRADYEMIDAILKTLAGPASTVIEGAGA